MSFSPAVSKIALKAMRYRIRKLKVRSKTQSNIKDIATWLNPIIQGWINYYGRFHCLALQALGRHINLTLIRWARSKYKTLRQRKTKACKTIEQIATQHPTMFTHWRAGLGTAFALWEPYELRGSRTVLREAVGEVPAAYSPYFMLLSLTG